MRRLPRVARPLAVDRHDAVERLSEDPGRWLPAPARRRGPGRWEVALGAGPAARSVDCGVGPAWRVGDEAVWRSLSWTPHPEPGDIAPWNAALPSFRGEIGVVWRGGDVQLELAGSYRPPGGLVGAAADAAVLHRVASATAMHFLDGIASALESVADRPSQ